MGDLESSSTSSLRTPKADWGVPIAVVGLQEVMYELMGGALALMVREREVPDVSQRRHSLLAQFAVQWVWCDCRNTQSC
jgi:hypothetical protein